jgi:hypothetical protein
MALLETSDFTGEHRISQEQNTITVLQGYINNYQPIYLAKLLGATLADAFVADVGGGTAPTDPLFLAIFDPFQKDGDCGGLHISNGIRFYLKGLIYWHFMKDKRIQANPVSGTSKANTENSSNSSTIESQVYDRWNESVKTMRAIQWYIEQNESDYPDYNGQRLLFNSAM